MKPSRGERRYILALLDGEELKTTQQARSRLHLQVHRKGFVEWQEKGHGEMTSGRDVVTDAGREAVGRARS